MCEHIMRRVTGLGRVRHEHQPSLETYNSTSTRVLDEDSFKATRHAAS